MNTKISDLLEQKKRRVLVLVVFLLIMALIWGREFFRPSGVRYIPPPRESTGKNFSVAPLTGGFGYSGATSLEDDSLVNQFKSYPPPDKFRSVVYPSKSLLTGQQSNQISVSGVCSDAYYALLVYSKAIDYRLNVGGSVYNSAFACQKGKQYSALLDLSTLDLTVGQYYYFAADLGSKGVWYNPR
jgi:hypothetical protein